MILLTIIFLYFLRAILLSLSAKLNNYLLRVPLIKFVFKIAGLILLVYFAVIGSSIVNYLYFMPSSTYFNFAFMSLLLTITFNLLLAYWYVFDRITLLVQNFLLTRQLYFTFVAFSAYLIMKTGISNDPSAFINILESIFKVYLEKEINDFDLVTSVENKFILGGQFFWFYLFTSFISFFCNPEVLLSEKIICIIFGPFFPGIGFFGKEISILGVNEIEGIKVITRSKTTVSRPQTQIPSIVKSMKVKPTITNPDLFDKIFFNLAEEKGNVEDWGLLTRLAEMGNLIIKMNPIQFAPTKHFTPFKDSLSLGDKIVKPISYLTFTKEYQNFLAEKERINQLRKTLCETGLSPYNLKFYQTVNRGHMLNMSEEQFREINTSLSTIAVFDSFCEWERQKNILQILEVSLSDGSKKNPFHAHTNKMLRFQFTDAFYTSQKMKLPLFPYLEKGQGDYVTIFDNKEHLLEVKNKGTIFSQEEVSTYIKEVLQDKKYKSIDSSLPFIISFNFPKLGESISEETLEKIREVRNNANLLNKISKIIITKVD